MRSHLDKLIWIRIIKVNVHWFKMNLNLSKMYTISMKIKLDSSKKNLAMKMNLDLSQNWMGLNENESGLVQHESEFILNGFKLIYRWDLIHFMMNSDLYWSDLDPYLQIGFIFSNCIFKMNPYYQIGSQWKCIWIAMKIYSDRNENIFGSQWKWIAMKMYSDRNKIYSP